ncbi:MAG TPA: PTS mannose transporter subunit IIAB [Clostridiales bacterium UBA9857]|nr:PTS sugar transporter subunit IIA [Candidatus Fermentithermobacillaceae bacterium]HAF66383.1 PTS mannose transporter subunit IIAB [Clostridiales bacterium UBA9857]HOA71107.1 PTS sugar transporter subunit IIA [Bacillota bacterium]HOP70295.1 PTS sugar transporter subunit IIA [Bacillota bacterium]HPT36037.1 PTS sugar transporter subunit IIA [Bacillota bacterium]
MVVIGILGHGEFPEGLLSAAELICGKQEKLFTAGLHPGDSPEAYAERVKTNIEKYGPDAEVLLLADLKGGTPGNIAAMMLSDSVACLTGANLPMLLHILLSRESASLSDLVSEALKAGLEGLTDLGAELRELK